MDAEAQLSPRNRVYIIGAVLIALFLCAMDALIMSVAMPTIVMELGGLELYAWAYSGFSLTNAVTLPIIGKLADLYDIKKLFIISIGFFIITSIAAGLANSMLFLVIARALQGFGAGGNMALVYIVLSDVSAPENRAKTLALGSFIWGISSVAGPSVGGFITTYMSWRWIFFINVPIGLISLTGIAILFKETRLKKRAVNLDIKGAITLCGWVFCLLTLILSGGEQFPWVSPQSIFLALVTIIFMAGFLISENRSPEPIISLKFFRYREFILGNGAAFLSSFGVFSLFAYAPLFIQGALRKSPMEVGYAMLTMSLAWTGAPIMLTRFVHAINNKAAIITGALLLTAGSGYLLTFGPSTTMLECLIAFVIIGLGMGFISICTLLVVQNALPPRDLGVATSSQQFFRTLGGTIGVAIAGAVATASLVSKLRSAGDIIPAGVFSQVSENIENIFRSDFFTPLSEEIKLILQNAVAGSISTVFWLVFGTALLALVSGLLIREGKKD
ncbi:MAG: MFS transporter [Desulfatiglans sp.]|jgi:EmrB/QacA subfamily drug resistance transporter|nr:MFS transporter [Desulfatiglans sp.]